MDSVFLNLTRGNRITSFMGLTLPTDTPPVYGPDYSYVEVPVKEIRNASTGELLEKGLRNQQVLVIPDCKVNVRSNYHLLVEPNFGLNQFGHVQGMFYIHTGLGEQCPSFAMILRKDMDLSEMGYAVRLYLQA